MNMWAKETNSQGKKYDDLGRFQLVITIFGSLDDPHANIIRRMSGGTNVSYSTLHKAIEAQQEFVKLSAPVEAIGELACYGMICIVDTRDSCIHNPITFQSK